MSMDLFTESPDLGAIRAYVPFGTLSEIHVFTTPRPCAGIVIFTAELRSYPAAPSMLRFGMVALVVRRFTSRMFRLQILLQIRWSDLHKQSLQLFHNLLFLLSRFFWFIHFTPPLKIRTPPGVAINTIIPELRSPQNWYCWLDLCVLKCSQLLCWR